MSQQSEKIVYLSQELFQAQKPRAPRAPVSGRPSSRVVAMRRIALTQTAKETGRTTPPLPLPAGEAEKTLTRYQAVEIEALIFYAAQQEGVAMERVQAQALNTLRIGSLSAMTVTEYRLIRDYLWQRIKG